MLSVSSCCITRRRDAPRAARMATSRCRTAARASIRLATFTQAMRSTRPTTADMPRSAGRSSCTPYSCMATTRTVCPTLSVENCCASARPMVSISLRAEARLTPGFRRPMQMNEFDPRLSSPTVHPAGTHSSRAALQNWKVKFAGMTPTTTYASPSMRIARPTTDGSAPYRRVHNPWLRTTTRSRPGCSSSREKVRPSAGRTPSTSKKLAVTRTPATCSGSDPPLRLYPRPAESKSARCAKERLRCDQSR